MSTAPTVIPVLALRLIALETLKDTSQGMKPSGAISVCARLRIPLARLMGIAGYRTLLSRAVALAKAEDSSLNEVQVSEDGHLVGAVSAGQIAVEGASSEAKLVCQLLDLLVVFIGEPLTRQLVRNAWSDTDIDREETNCRCGVKP